LLLDHGLNLRLERAKDIIVSAFARREGVINEHQQQEQLFSSFSTDLRNRLLKMMGKIENNYFTTLDMEQISEYSLTKRIESSN
jgi:hypothetical protein